MINSAFAAGLPRLPGGDDFCRLRNVIFRDGRRWEGDWGMQESCVRRVHAVFFLLLFLVLSCLPVPLPGARAEELPAVTDADPFVAEYGVKYLTSDPESMVPVDIINFKARLRDLGFYVAGVDDSTLQERCLDDLTMAAVREVSRLNPQLAYHPEGVSNLMYWCIMDENGYGANLKTPLSDSYRLLTMGEQSDDVTRVQNRLIELGYGASGNAFSPGLYDVSLQGAIEEFARCNNISVGVDEGISAELQRRLFAADAAAYVPEEGGDALSAAQRILGYFAAEGSFMGLTLPNGVLWGVGFVLVCAIVILLIKLFASDSKGDAQREEPRPGELTFRVEYDGETCIYRDTLRHYVRIGRATDKFPLNLSDKGISRKHCEIYSKDGKLMLRDFSSNGTSVNGRICHHAEQVLHSGDVLKVGNHKITIQYLR